MEPVPYEELCVLASIAGYRNTSYRSLNALMTNAAIHSVQTGSEYFQIDSFLLAPAQFRQDPGGPTVPPVSQVKTTDRYADLWQRIAVNNLVPLNDYETLPYDMYCPSVKSAVKQRVCNLCGIYFPSIAAVKQGRVVKKENMMMKKEAMMETIMKRKKTETMTWK